MNPADLNKELLRRADLLEEALEELKVRGVEDAAAEQTWRLNRSTAYVHTSGTVAEREAEVEIATSGDRYKAKLAEAMKVSALEAVRARRAILSAFQTVANLSREEMSFARSGPQEGP